MTGQGFKDKLGHFDKFLKIHKAYKEAIFKKENAEKTIAELQGQSIAKQSDLVDLRIQFHSNNELIASANLVIENFDYSKKNILEVFEFDNIWYVNESKNYTIRKVDDNIEHMILSVGGASETI